VKSLGGGPQSTWPIIQFAVAKGKAPYTWTIKSTVNNPASKQDCWAGSIDNNGLYTSQRHMATGTITVTDADGNSATTTVTVTTSDIVAPSTVSLSLDGGTTEASGSLIRVSMPPGDHKLTLSTSSPTEVVADIGTFTNFGTASVLIDGTLSEDVFPSAGKPAVITLTRQ